MKKISARTRKALNTLIEANEGKLNIKLRATFVIQCEGSFEEITIPPQTKAALFIHRRKGAVVATQVVEVTFFMKDRQISIYRDNSVGITSLSNATPKYHGDKKS